MKCIYCDSETSGKNRTKEHVIPQWIISKLNIKKKQLSFTPISEELEVYKERTPTPHTLTHKVCNDCNNGWLHEIDGSCKEFLESLIDGYFIVSFFTEDNLNKLKTLIYKILLNLLATGPEPFKIKKALFYHDFFNNRTPPKNISFFFTHYKDKKDENFDINYLDYWIAENEKQRSMISNTGFRFKIYLQLGKIGFVLCSTGDENSVIAYDEEYLDLIMSDVSAIGGKFNTILPCEKPIQNISINRFLMNVIRPIDV